MANTVSEKPHTDYDSVAEIYDLYVTSGHDVPFFLEEATRVSGRVLELAAGTGRLSLPLVEAGVRLTCVDRSPGMLAVLNRKLEASGLHAEVRCEDICALQPERRFELAILAFQSFMEIVGEDRQRQALDAVQACLQPKGRFVCTAHNPSVRRRQVDGLPHLVGRFPTPEGSMTVSGVECGGDPVVRRLQTFEFFDVHGRLVSQRTLPMEFELIEKERFEDMARGAGFDVLNLYGSYDRSPFETASSPVMIWVLSKSQEPA